MSQIEDAFEGELPEEVILPVADEIVDLVLELADAAGAADVTPEMAEQAKVLTGHKIMEEYGVVAEDYEQAAGQFTPEDLDGVQQMMQGAV